MRTGDNKPTRRRRYSVRVKRVAGGQWEAFDDEYYVRPAAQRLAIRLAVETEIEAVAVCDVLDPTGRDVFLDLAAGAKKPDGAP